MSDDICVKHVKRGQSVTLCASHTTTPSKIPQGKHVISISKSQWVLVEKNRHLTLYSCSKGSCTRQSPSVNHTRYPDVSDSCLIINNVQEKELYSFNIHFYPSNMMAVTSVHFLVTNEGTCVWMCVRVFMYYYIISTIYKL